MDFTSKWLSLALYQIGISTDPGQVVIGREGWLFLGDNYKQSQTVSRRGKTSDDLIIGQKIGDATIAWDHWLASKGVRLFRVMIGPNKETIYPEYLPMWAKPSSPTATDALLTGTGTQHYIDLREPLLAAKTSSNESLYYHTDTHWNSLGAGVAYRAFAQEVSRSIPEIRWPVDDAFEVSSIGPRYGGDLANFLRISENLHDMEPVLNATNLPIETTQYDFDSRIIIHKGGNPQVGAPRKPVLIKSVGALNAKKVLWLRDSFGSALSPLMAATFTETVQLHGGVALAPGGRFIELVEKWKPDYVFITVVEREARDELFATYPPISIIGQPGDFKQLRTTAPLVFNQILKGSASNEYKLNGLDPFVVYTLSAPIEASEAQFLSINLVCRDNTEKVPMQLYWLKDGKSYFDEENSMKFTVSSGLQLIDLRTVSGWAKSGTIHRLRLDSESQSTCSEFKLSNPIIGVLPNHQYGFNSK